MCGTQSRESSTPRVSARCFVSCLKRRGTASPTSETVSHSVRSADAFSIDNRNTSIGRLPGVGTLNVSTMHLGQQQSTWAI